MDGVDLNDQSIISGMAKRRAESKPYARRKDARSPAGYFFREWREFRGLTQERAAERAEVSKAMISQLENGDQGVSDRALAALAHAYNCEIGDLFRDPNRPEYQLWEVISEMKPEQRQRALQVLKALVA